MMALEDILSQEIVQKLGWTLLHFVWQAAVAALLLSVLLRVLRKSTANLRYVLACLTLGLIVLLPVITLHLVPISASYPTAPVEPAPVPSFLPMEEIKQVPGAEMPVLEEPVQPVENVAITPKVSWKQRTVELLEPALPYIVSGWLVGVFGLSLWHLGGWTQMQRLRRRRVKQIGPPWQSKLKELAKLLGIRRVVQLMESALVRVPTVVGWLRPVILLPASALTGLSSEQLEAILAHELAHIRRYDYLINMLQTVVEILGFYHPAVWWVSHKIRAERENCCDDLAVRISGDRVCYARALTSMEEIRAGRGQLAVAASGGNLFRRIYRLLGKDSAPNTRFSWAPAVIAITLIAALAIPTTLALTASRNQNTDVQISARELIAKIIESEKKIKDIRLHMTCTIGALDRTFYEYDWGYDDTKEFLSGTDNRKDSRTGAYRAVKVIRAFDGKREWLFRNDPKSSRPSGGITKPNPNFSFSGGIMTFNTLLGFDAKELSRLSLGQAIAQAESVSVKEQVEFIDGRPCYVIEAINLEIDPSVHWAYDVRAWIDYQRDYRPLRFEKYRSIPGKNRFKVVSRRVDNIKLEQIDGIWLPIQGDRTSFSTNVIRPPKGMTRAQFAALPTEEREQVGVFKLTPMVPTRRLEIDVESIRLNKGISPEAFTIVFPDGCEVYDEFTGNRYIVGEQSEKEAALSDAELIEQTKKLSVSELIDVLRSKSLGLSKRRWFAVIHRLVEIGSPAVPQLVAEIRKTEQSRTQSRIALTLRAIGAPNAVAGLIDALERAGFSSDYGFGEPKTELGRFYKTYQMDPTKKGLGLGRPVREITIALERLTGHSEGHDHFHAYDSKGKQLGSYIVTPEIRDRQREHRRQVAERWRKWWQENKDKVDSAKLAKAQPQEIPAPKEAKTPRKRDYGIIAAPEGAMLTLAIVPHVDGSGRQPSLTKEEYQWYLDDLAHNGPFAGSGRGDSFQWSPIKDDVDRFKGLPLSTYKERTYLLLCARTQYVMIPEFEGRWVWGLEKVQPTTDAAGRPAISLQFDEKGSELFYELTKANVGNHLAIGVDSLVLSAPRIETPLRKRAIITGDFTEQQVRTFVEDLRKGMPPVDQQTIKAMQLIAEAADKLNKQDVAKMGPRQVVENLFVVGLSGNAEKLTWFFRPGSVADGVFSVRDFAQMADGRKIKVLEVYADSNDALAITSNIKGKSGDLEGQLIFYLSKQTGTWLIYDGDAGDSEKARENVAEFLITHPDVRVEGESEVSKLLASLKDEKYAHTRSGIIPLVEENGQELLDKLRSYDSAFLNSQTISMEMEKPVNWARADERQKTKIVLTTDNGSIGWEEEISYLSDPRYREGLNGIDRIQYVWNVTRKQGLIENDFQARRREMVLLLVSPWGDFAEKEAAPVVEFRQPSDRTKFIEYTCVIWSTGRGFADHLKGIIEAKKDENGLIHFTAHGNFSPNSDGLSDGLWEMVVDPKSGYLVRSASFTGNGHKSPVFICTTIGTKWFDNCSLAKEARFSTWDKSKITTTQTVQFKLEPDAKLFDKLRKTLRSELPKDTRVEDCR